MADAPPSKSSAKPAADGDSKRSRKAGLIRSIIGWVMVPSLVVATLFLAGLHVGARYPEMALSRAVLWATNAEPQLPPATSKEAAPLSRQLYLLALPTKEYGLEIKLEAEDVERLAGNVDSKTLDCKQLCARVWMEQHPDKEFVEATDCKVEDHDSPIGTLECELIVER